ncbi:MAG TPA: 2-hydroxychromene-2-carboxylate isomerase [Verrucomicrobiae bacterium]|nr:2-hydroxychromene-2-carboxylate isomerase [Verrucomicrobiae bacterium]
MTTWASPERLYFFFDYISHNAYLAWHALPALARKHGLVVTPVPVLFGAMLSHYKQVGPAEVPAKSAWMLRNVLRKAKERGIPIAPPASHPFNPLVTLRATCADMTDAQRSALVDRLFRAVWAESRPVTDAAAVRPLLAEVGLDADAILQQVQGEPVKQRLRENTQAALDLGAFGVPTMKVRDELFWGYDDLEYLDQVLSGKDPLSADRHELKPWASVRPSIERRR